MNARITNATVARCLMDISFLDAFEGQGETQEAISHDVSGTLQTLDLVRLRQFAGFITKIRHNYLWEELPYTRQLILRYRIETQVFTEYCPLFQSTIRETEKLSRAVKTSLFAEYLRGFLAVDSRRAKYPALYDVLIHECILLQLRDATVDPGTERATVEAEEIDFETLDPGARIWIPGFIKCASFEYSPQEVISSMRHARNTPFVPFSEGDKAFVYWKKPSSQTLQIFECDWLTVTILSLINDSPCMTTGTLMKLLKDDNIIELIPESNLLNDCLNGLYAASLLRVAVNARPIGGAV